MKDIVNKETDNQKDLSQFQFDSVIRSILRLPPQPKKKQLAEIRNE